MGGGAIDDGEVRVQTDGSGGQYIDERVDNLANNYKATDNVTSGYSANLTNSN